MGRLKKRTFTIAEGVSNIELFYDLIFVYCISVITSLCHHIEGGFLAWNTWLTYMFSFMVVLQVWLFTTLLMNRYGDRSAADNICLFINMFLLYFLAHGIQTSWLYGFAFDIAWALILANLILHWSLKRLRYDNLDDTDKHIMNRTILVLAAQLAMVLIAAFLPKIPSMVVSWLGLFFGSLVWVQAPMYKKKPSRFSHVAERCALLVIIAFGETIVAIASYITYGGGPLYPTFVFALVVGLFLIYIFEHDNMIDHHKESDGMVFMTITAWTIVIIGNLTVALEYMPDPQVTFLPKSIMLTVFLVLYLLVSFLLGRYNKPQFHYSVAYVIGRLGTCVFIVVVALATNFQPMVNLICDTAAIYFALWHEWMLYRRRSCIIAFGHSLGYSNEDLLEAGYTFATREGRQAIRESLREAKEVVAECEELGEPCDPETVSQKLSK